MNAYPKSLSIYSLLELKILAEEQTVGNKLQPVTCITIVIIGLLFLYTCIQCFCGVF